MKSLYSVIKAVSVPILIHFLSFNETQMLSILTFDIRMHVNVWCPDVEISV